MSPRSEKLPEINNASFITAREEKGLDHKELAHALCLSAKHIEQLEKNEVGIFFSLQHRYQVAKKVAAHLNLKDDEAFIYYTEVAYEEETQVEQVITEASFNEISDVPDLQENKNTLVIDKLNPTIIKEWPLKKTLYVFAAASLAIIIYSTAHQNIDVITAYYNENKTVPIKEDSNVIVANQINDEGKVISNPCEYNQSLVFQYANNSPSKVGNYVYVVSNNKATLCVIDAQNNSTILDLDGGTSKSIYGKPPFVLISKDLHHLDIFYQGSKIFGVPIENNVIQLTEKSVNIFKE